MSIVRRIGAAIAAALAAVTDHGYLAHFGDRAEDRSGGGR